MLHRPFSSTSTRFSQLIGQSDLCLQKCELLSSQYHMTIIKLTAKTYPPVFSCFSSSSQMVFLIKYIFYSLGLQFHAKRRLPSASSLRNSVQQYLKHNVSGASKYNLDNLEKTTINEKHSTMTWINTNSQIDFLLAHVLNILTGS